MSNKNSSSVWEKRFDWFQRRIIANNLSGLVMGLTGTCLFLIVFVSGYFASSIPLTTSIKARETSEQEVESNKLLIGGVYALNSLLVVAYISSLTAYIASSNEKIKESNKNHLVFSIPQSDLEYLSLIRDALKLFPNRYDGLSNVIIEMSFSLGKKEFEEKLDEDLNNFRIRQEALTGLTQGLRDETDPDGLNSTIVAASDFALGNNASIKDKDQFYKCMYAYISAWLTCSISYNLNKTNQNSLPIDSIFYQDSKHKDLYIKAIRDMIDRFNFQPANIFFNSDKSVKIIQDYLTELVDLINDKPAEPEQSYVIKGTIPNTKAII
jgi:hypothetical protein